MKAYTGLDDTYKNPLFLGDRILLTLYDINVTSGSGMIIDAKIELNNGVFGVNAMGWRSIAEALAMNRPVINIQKYINEESK